jgi:hypothetical protein
VVSRSLGAGDSSPCHSTASWWRRRYGAPLLGELVLVSLLFVLYRQIRLFTRDDFRDAFAHAREVLSIEHALGLSLEDNLQRLVLANRATVWFFNHYYAYAHFVPTVVVLAWLFPRHETVYRWMRWMLVLVTFPALIIHVAYPLAPPRMMPGFVDTMMRFGPQIYGRSRVAGLANQIAAMPSLHFGWSIIVAAAVVKASGWRWRRLVLLHPITMALAIVGTANHWWLDAMIAGVLVGMAWIVLSLVTERRLPWREPVLDVSPIRFAPRRSRVERRPVEAVDGGERRNRVAAQPAELLPRVAEEHDCGKPVAVGQAQQRPRDRLGP